MATDLTFAEYVCDQARGAGRLEHRRMFGEYAFYCDGKVVALLCDNQCFLKPTAAGRALLPSVREGTPFPGARPFLLIDEVLEDAEAFARLVAATAAELPAPKPKKSKPPKAAKATRKAASGAKSKRTKKSR